MSGTSQVTQLYFHVGERSYELRPAPLKILKKIWIALPKMRSLSERMQVLIEEAGGKAADVSDDSFMQLHSERVDILVGVLCEAVGIQRSEAEDNLTKQQVEDLTPLFNQYLELSGFVQDEDPNGVTGPVIAGPINSTAIGTPSRPN